MAELGTLVLRCPQCDQTLHVPVIGSLSTSTHHGEAICTIQVDGAYLRAHALTHTHHDGEPHELVAAA